MNTIISFVDPAFGEDETTITFGEVLPDGGVKILSPETKDD